MKCESLKITVASLVITIILGINSVPALGASTTAVLGGGIAINEILIDPTGDTTSFDTDNSGAADDLDEFLELYNDSSSTIDISGWELWDSGVMLWYTFPGAPDSGTTTLAPDAYAVVVAGVQSGGSLPDMTNPNSISFNAGNGSPAMNNSGDNVVLYDPAENEYIQLLYNGDAADDPTSSYTGFSSTAVRVGSVEDFGSDEDGKSLTRYPSGDTNVVVHDSIPGAGDASPTSVTLHSLGQGRKLALLNVFLGVLLAALGLAGLGFFFLIKRPQEP